MCLAIPARITRVADDGRTAEADIGGIEKSIEIGRAHV